MPKNRVDTQFHLCYTFYPPTNIWKRVLPYGIFASFNHFKNVYVCKQKFHLRLFVVLLFF